MHKLRLILLSPIGLVYGVIGLIRRRTREERYQPEVPAICVGNLAVGGTGKTPMIEYLVRLLSKDHRVATLSRGYKRATKGFLSSLQEEVTVEKFGDEPTQIHHKFPEMEVAVCESRVEGVKRMLAGENAPDLILLDDAYQHISIKSSVNLLLTDYSKPYTKDFPLPAGNLREFPCAAKEADAIVVTKCPPTLSAEEATAIREELKVAPEQKCFFSCIQYRQPRAMTESAERSSISKESTVILLTGIANPKPLCEKTREEFAHITHIQFSDHHNFSKKEIQSLCQKFTESPSNTIIITTEKDWCRLQSEETAEAIQQLPVFVMGIETKFLFDGDCRFGEWISGRLA